MAYDGLKDDFGRGGAGPSGRTGAEQAPGSMPASGASKGKQEQERDDKPSLLPAITTPTGGGAIRGIGEKFGVSAATGSASLSIPMPASPGRNGLEPQVELGYDTAKGNGPFGIGFDLSLPRITRKTDKGLPRYLDDDESDEFILSGSEDLVPTRDPVTGSPVQIPRGDYTARLYRPRVEGTFARIERWIRNSDGDVHWRVTTSDNVTYTYGLSTDARISDPAAPTEGRNARIFSWLLEQTQSDRGDIIRYEYKGEDGRGVSATRLSERSRFNGTAFAATAQRYLKRVLYVNALPDIASDFLMEMVLDYGEHAAEEQALPDDAGDWDVRQDPFSSYHATFEVRTYRLCKRILMFHRLSADRAPVLVRSTVFKHDPSPTVTYLIEATQKGHVRDPNTGVWTTLKLPTLSLAFTRADLHDELSVLPPESLEGLEGGVDGVAKQWVDLDGEGIPGVLVDSDTAWYYKSNQGAGQLAPPRVLPTLPSPAATGGSAQQLQDLGGDGQLDLVSYAEPFSGYFERTPDGDWEGLRAFPSLPHLDWDDPNLRFVDLDGDGIADLLVTDDQAFMWYRSRGKDGFEPGMRVAVSTSDDRGPTLAYSDTSQSIQLVDMSGDGLIDIVRVRNGEVSYWPSLGYGRFGARVTLEGSPVFANVDEFDARRIRFGDVDGTGTADIFYLGPQDVTLFRNQSGNSLAPGEPIRSLPPVDNVAQLGIVDLLGQGMSSVVWSSPLPGSAGRSVMYVDLMAGQKPHLLKTIDNNLGAVTTISHAPATKFYLADKMAGTPWLTRLPFPVHVVETVEIDDAISKSHLVTSYSYHHGFYDGVEREFRGFARVEQLDAETFTIGAAGTETFQPPTRTVSWFHTGAWLEKERLESQLANEYFQQGPPPLRRPDTIFTTAQASPPLVLTIQDEREAARALAGTMLRQEIYAEDAVQGDPDPPAKRPFLVTEVSVEARMLQTSKTGRHGVFLICPQETVTIHSERNASDPRISHELALEVDDLGNVTKTADITYPRVTPLFAEQQRAWAIYQENSYFNHAGTDFNRIGVPFQEKTFELTGLPSAPAGEILSLAAVRSAVQGIDALHTLEYDAIPTGNGTERRLIDHRQHLFYADDLSGALLLGDAGQRALPFESYQLVFTAGLVAELGDQAKQLVGVAFDPTASLPGLLTGDGHYVQFPPDTGYWTRSGRAVFRPDHFYLATQAIDPVGQPHSLTYDDFDLLIVDATDPMGNVTSAVNDYRVLHPALVTDPNLNQVAVAFDALGMVVASALMGKVPGEGDPLAQPTTRLEYNVLNWQDNKQPASVHTFQREQHGPANTRFLETFAYSDGFGRVAMEKTQAEPLPGSGTARWIGTGRTVFNNKGNAVKQYEPFFSATSDFEDEAAIVQTGVTPIIHYDALDRVIRTEFPNGTLTRVTFDPWREENWDENDTVFESTWYSLRGNPPASDPEPIGDAEKRAAWLAARHAQTPTVTHLDTLGRAFRVVAQNRVYSDAGVPTDLFNETRTRLDITENILGTVDARQVGLNPTTPLEGLVQRFDMLGRQMWTKSADAGRRVILLDVADKEVRTWDERGQVMSSRYDLLQRETHLFVQKTPDPTNRLVIRTVYGEALDPLGPSDDPTAPSAAQALNLRGQPYLHYDCGGAITVQRFDFKANLVDSERRLASDFQNEPDWTVIANLTDPAAIQTQANGLLEQDTPNFRTRFPLHNEYDALDRITRHVGSDNATVTHYNLAGLIEQVLIGIRGGTPQVVVNNVDYNARGQRTHYEYSNPNGAAGNVVCTTDYTYDPQTFRLQNILTSRTSNGTVLQNLGYTFDPVGNVVQMDDAGLFATTVPSSSSFYIFDALYQLVQSRGREHPSQTAQPTAFENPPGNIPNASDLQALVRYTENYSYDRVGNIERISHISGQTGPNPTQWTRRYGYATDSNRLTATSLPGEAEPGLGENYTYTAHGSMTKMGHLPVIDWDYADRMKHANLQGGGDVFFTYDGGGNRLRKVWIHSNLVEDRIYVGAWEIYRRRQNSISDPIVVERETVHVMDEDHRVAMVETQTVGAPGGTLWRFQLDNHLESSLLELDEAGNAITYEEYHPYGSTAFHAANTAISAKRYRYIGKERDEETGLSYHGARYYAPWLGRWTAADPEGFVDGPNVYAYAVGNPVTLADPFGTQTYIPHKKAFTEMDPTFDPKIPHFEGIGPKFFEPLVIEVKPKHHHKHRHHRPKPPHKEKPKETPTEPKPAPGPTEPEPPPQAAPGPEGAGGPPTPKPATAGEAAGAFIQGAVEGAVTSAVFSFGLALLGPVGVAIGVGFAAYGLYKLATGGYKDVVGTVKRIATGQGTTEDFKAAGGFVAGLPFGKLRARGGKFSPVKYNFGPEGQVVKATAQISRANLHQGTPTTVAARVWTRIVGKKGDEAGHIIGKLLGGRGGLRSKNIVPMNAKLNKGEYQIFERDVAALVQKEGKAKISISLKYPRGSKRPNQIIYRVKVNGKLRMRQEFNQ